MRRIGAHGLFVYLVPCFESNEVGGEREGLQQRRRPTAAAVAEAMRGGVKGVSVPG